MDSLTDQLCLQDLVAAASVGSHHQPQGHHHQHHHNVQIPDTTTHMQSSGAVQGHNNSPVTGLTAPSFASPHHHVTTLLPPPPTMTSHHHHLHHLNHAMSSAQTMTRTGLLTTNGTDHSQQPCSTTMHENNKQKRGKPLFKSNCFWFHWSVALPFALPFKSICLVLRSGSLLRPHVLALKSFPGIRIKVRHNICDSPSDRERVWHTLCVDCGRALIRPDTQ